jgi:hypothetical protein
LVLLLALAASVAGVAAPAPRPQQPVTPADYAADAQCLSCHADKKTYLGTAHHLTSRPPTEDAIAGRFDEGHNTLETAAPDLAYRMEERKDGFFQTAVIGVPPNTMSISKRFDFVIGSGRKGQTYLTWRDGDRLYELPVSYWTALRTWANSPGYTDVELDFGRPVVPRCLECHASAFESVPGGAPNRYKPAGYVLGISCAKCHGPGRDHVAARLARAAPAGQEIVNPAKLPRARQIEVCALCHGGLGAQLAPAFTYVPGKPLEDYLRLRPLAADETVDVHGNQIALLERSRCFQGSNMTCSTCHDVHRPQRTAAAFSSACLTCHKVESCGMAPKLGRKIADNCVDCHMPLQTSNAIFSIVEGKRLQPQVRTHWIKPYPAKSGA